MWSDINIQSKSKLKPKFNFRSWDMLDIDTRQLIHNFFLNENWFTEDDITLVTVIDFNDEHKVGNFCHHLMGEISKRSAFMDVSRIFIRENKDVVYELISYYSVTLRGVDITKYNKFIKFFNDISNQFGLDILLMDNGLIMKQENKIQEYIYSSS